MRSGPWRSFKSAYSLQCRDKAEAVVASEFRTHGIGLGESFPTASWLRCGPVDHDGREKRGASFAIEAIADFSRRLLKRFFGI